MPGDALTVAMPPSSRQGHAAFRTVRMVAIRDGAEARPEIKGAKQRALIEQLRGQPHPQGVSVPDLGRLGFPAGTIRSLVKAGVLTMAERITERDPFAALDGALAGRGPVVVAGSLYLVGMARGQLVDDPDLRDPGHAVDGSG